MNLRLSWQMLQRGGIDTSLRLLVLALVIGVASVTTTGFLADRIERALTREGARFLGADLVVTSPKPLARLPTHALATAYVLEFTSMASTTAAFQLVNVRAVDAGYPVRGEVRIAASPSGPARVRPALPPPGAVYVETRLLPLLGAQVGDVISVGDARLRIAGLIREEPGQNVSIFGLAPGLLMRADGVDATGVVQPGSRVRHHYQFGGAPDAIARFKAELAPRLARGQRLSDARDNQDGLRGPLAKATSYLRLAGVASLLLAVVAIALAAQHHARQRIDEAALLRCLGLGSREFVTYQAGQWLLVGLAACAVGVALAAGLQGLLAAWLLPPSFANLPGLSWQPVVAGVGSGLLALLGAALPALISLVNVPPLRVLRRELPPPRGRVKRGMAFLVLLLCALVFWHARDARLAGYTLVALAALALLLWGLAHALQRLSRTAARLAPGVWRLGLQQLARHRLDTTLQVGAFSTVLFLLGLLWLVRSDLVSEWRQQLPADAPNHFLLNIAPEQRADLDSWLAHHAEFATEAYPMVRGRLVSRNGQPIESSLSPEQRQSGSLRRELNLSHTSRLHANNRIVAGEWFGTRHAAEISLESGLAETLGIRLGDTLGFRVGDQTVNATVSSLRQVEWASFQPNFFVLFARGQLDGLPTTHLIGTRIGAASVPALVKAFPGVTVVAFDRIIAQIQGLVTQISQGVMLMLGFLLASGLAVVYASLAAGLAARERECVLMRALGAERMVLTRALQIEFMLAGGVAGLIAALGAEATIAALASQVFELMPRTHPGVWFALPLMGAGLAGGSGWLATRHIVHTPPIQALQAL